MRGATRLSALDFCFALALASFFSGIYQDTGFVRLRPFEVLSLVCVIGTLVRYSTRIFDIPAVFWAAAAFLACHAISAFSVGSTNGFRETIQVTEILSFTAAFLVHYRHARIEAMAKVFAIMALLVMAYAAIWHIQSGYYFGWKRLGDPKFAFLLLPVFASALFRNEKGTAPISSYMVLVAAMAIVFFSGERKSYFVALCALVLIFGMTNLRLLIVLGLVLLFAGIATVADPNGYLAHQVTSIIAPDVERNWVTLSYSDVPQSLSNAQRVFASDLVADLFQQYPIFGVGTNGYLNIVENRFWFLPEFMRVSVHNEFSRILVENGLFGFSLYAFAWLVASRRLGRTTNFTHWWRGMHGTDRTRTLFFAACLCFCFFEASKSLSLIAFIFAAFADVIVPQQRKETVASAQRHSAMPEYVAMSGRPP